MFANGPDRGPPSALRGWLSDVYFPALLDEGRAKALDALASRLGAKATVDDPIQGRATGLPPVSDQLKRAAEWLSKHSASYHRLAFTTGIDRDVTEGTLSLAFESKTVDLPVAVVAERRRSREVELRIYHALQPLETGSRTRARIVADNPEAIVPPAVAGLLDGLSKGNVGAIEATFEADGAVRDAQGLTHARSDNALRAFFEGLVAGGAFGGGLELQRGGAADDGRTCAVEYTLVKARGKDVTPPQAGLLLFERGDSGLIRVARMYGDLEG